MGTLHLTGFEDWAYYKSTGDVPNPTRLLVEDAMRNPGLQKKLAGLAGAEEIQGHILPVPKGEIDEVKVIFRNEVEKLLAKIQEGDAVLSLGQGGIPQQGPTIEIIFKNGFKVTKDELLSPIDSTISDTNFQIRVPEKISDLAKKLSEKNPSIILATDAGNYLCNMLGFLLSQRLGERTIFSHLPFFPDDERLLTKFWARNEERYRRHGVEKKEDLGCASIAENFAFIESLVSVWKPFAP